MTLIRRDLDGVVYVDVAGSRVILRAGDEVPAGVTVGDHLVDSTPQPKANQAEPLRAGEPDRSGRDATRAAWFVYATEELGIEGIDDKTGRDKIIALVDAHAAAEK